MKLARALIGGGDVKAAAALVLALRRPPSGVFLYGGAPPTTGLSSPSLSWSLGSSSGEPARVDGGGDSAQRRSRGRATEIGRAEEDWAEIARRMGLG